MTKFDQLCLEVRRLRLEVRRQSARIEALEGRRHQRPRPVAPQPTDAIIAARVRLWDRFILLQVGHGPTTKLAFAIRHRLGDPSEFCRFFAGKGRGIPEGSTPAQRYYAALRDAIEGLERSRKQRYPNLQLSHGIGAGSPFSDARPQ